MQLLQRVPDELKRLDRENRKLKREANASPSRIDPSSKRFEKWWESRWETREKTLIREQDERIVQIRTHYEQQLKNSEEVLQKNNSELQHRLKERSKENEELKQRLQQCEQQLQELRTSSKSRKDEERYTYKQQMLKAKHALEEKRKELDSFKERHAAFSERKVRSDQRRTENTLSRNRQSQLESEYVTEFKDGSRVDAIDIMTARVRRLQGARFTSLDYLKCCRLACFIFETSYEVAANVKDSFSNFSSAVLNTLATEAPAIGSNSKTPQNELTLLRQQYAHQKVTALATQDALSEVLILVKEEAKTHDLSSLEEEVKRSISSKWIRTANLLLEYDSVLLHDLNDYINYCTRFAWCALTQVPPMKINYSTAAYSSRSHIMSQAFAASETRSPSRRSAYTEAQKILCYLWPVLQDCDGKIIRKGEVVLVS